MQQEPVQQEPVQQEQYILDLIVYNQGYDSGFSVVSDVDQSDVYSDDGVYKSLDGVLRIM